MNAKKESGRHLLDVKIDVKIKLAALWVTLMFFYLYADIVAFYQPGHIEDVMTGEVVGIQINELFLLGTAVLMAIPSVMVFLSLALKARANRWMNIIVGVFYAGVLLATMLIPTGTEKVWTYYTFYVIVEALFIALIVWHAWTWPRQEA
ncbi:MAG: hypothetical protein JSW03_04785 [Candidatus Eiseniibacteriota bacterium]|nr:MAG: hypothetical protein JSW03_04785 [Candidatus Eisenbacteria bacterium]